MYSNYFHSKIVLSIVCEILTTVKSSEGSFFYITEWESVCTTLLALPYHQMMKHFQTCVPGLHSKALETY